MKPNTGKFNRTVVSRLPMQASALPGHRFQFSFQLCNPLLTLLRWLLCFLFFQGHLLPSVSRGTELEGRSQMRVTKAAQRRTHFVHGPPANQGQRGSQSVFRHCDSVFLFLATDIGVNGQARASCSDFRLI